MDVEQYMLQTLDALTKDGKFFMPKSKDCVIPEMPRAKLERYILKAYPRGDTINAICDATYADKHKVEAAIQRLVKAGRIEQRKKAGKAA